MPQSVRDGEEPVWEFGQTRGGDVFMHLRIQAEGALPGLLMKSSQVSCGSTPGPSHGRPLMIACTTETLPAIISLKCITAVGVAMAAHGREALL
ncbi:hypothetical protein MHYP_G00010670 [Metynnis hypsauchen]